MKLHLGCGDRVFPGWTHLDERPLPHVDYCRPAEDLSCFEDGCADVIYASHLLEHYPRGETRSVLREWHRVLRVGGTLRVAVPDFQAIAEAYVVGDVELSNVLGPLIGRQDYPGNFHYCIFDELTLRMELLGAGFYRPRRYDWRMTEHAHIDDYSQSYWPHMDKEHGRLLSLNMEAKKWKPKSCSC